MNRQILIFDSSALSKMLECEQAHDYEYAQSIIQINRENPKLTFQVPDKIAAGTLGHKYLEIYYKTLGVTQDPAAAVRRALDFDPDKEDVADNHEYPLDKDLRKRVRNRFEDYIFHYGRADYNVATRSKVQIAVESGWLKDVSIPEPLVEQGFSYELYNSSEYLFVLEGRIDFIGSAAGENLWMDHKWQLRERNLYSKSIQFRNYALVTKFPLGIVNYVRLHDKLCAKTLVRQPISFSPGELAAWKEELTEIYVSIAKKQRGAAGDFPARNRSACSGKFGYPCPYTSLCDIYDPRQRAATQQMMFTKKKEWKPW